MQRGGLENEEGVTSGTGGEGVVALGAARHVRLHHRHVRLDHVDVQLVLGCAGTVMLTIDSDLQTKWHQRISADYIADEDI